MLIPDSPRSTLSGLSSSPPKLDPSTLALLDSFLIDKAEEEQKFKELAAEHAAAQLARLALDTDDGENKVLSVDEYCLAFGEDWQLSQFCCLYVLCCPTGFVAFQHMKQLCGTKLFEYDRRLAVLSLKNFVPYDLDEPDNIPKALRGTIDIAVVDPPYLNEITNVKLATTLRQILHPQRGRLIVITSTSVEDTLFKVYGQGQLGPLRRTVLKVEHRQLVNDFACWGSWDGAEHFGETSVDEDEHSLTNGGGH